MDLCQFGDNGAISTDEARYQLFKLAAIHDGSVDIELVNFNHDPSAAGFKKARGTMV